MKKYIIAMLAILASSFLLGSCQLNTHKDYAIGVASVTNGKVAVSDTTAASGQVVTLTLTPDSGYAYSAVTISGVSSLASTSVDKTTNVATVTFAMPDQNATVTATFATAYKIAGSADVYGNTLSADYGTAAAGTTVTVAVSPITGYALLGGSLLVNGTSPTATPVISNSLVSSIRYTFTMPSTDVVLAGSFAATSVTNAITYPASDSHFSSVSGVTSAAAGEIVNVNVSPSSGYALKTLTADNATVLSKAVDSATYYYFVMPQSAVTLTATFTEATTVALSAVDGHAVATDARGSLAFYSDSGYTKAITAATIGSVVYVKAVPVLATDTISIKVNGISVADGGAFIAPASEVTAVFTIDAATTTYTITPVLHDSQGNVTTALGTMSLSATTAKTGELVTIKLNPAVGYKLKPNTVTVGTTSIPSPSSTLTYSFLMPANNVTVTAAFWVPPSAIVLDFESATAGTSLTSAYWWTGAAGTATVVLLASESGVPANGSSTKAVKMVPDDWNEVIYFDFAIPATNYVSEYTAITFKGYFPGTTQYSPTAVLLRNSSGASLGSGSIDGTATGWQIVKVTLDSAAAAALAAGPQTLELGWNSNTGPYYMDDITLE